MNKDQFSGRLKQVAGRVKALAGKTVGNSRLQREGRAAQHSGVVQAAFGDAKHATQTRIKTLMRRIRVQS